MLRTHLHINLVTIGLIILGLLLMALRRQLIRAAEIQQRRYNLDYPKLPDNHPVLFIPGLILIVLGFLGLLGIL
jgi:hypothetical protein